MTTETSSSQPSLTSLIEQPFGEFVRAIRKEFGLNQSEAAEAFGVSQATICRWEQGRQTPTLLSFTGLEGMLRKYKADRAAQGAVPENDTPKPDLWPRDPDALDPGDSIPPRELNEHAERALQAFGEFIRFRKALLGYRNAVIAHHADPTLEKMQAAQTAGLAVVEMFRRAVFGAPLSPATDDAVGVARESAVWTPFDGATAVPDRLKAVAGDYLMAQATWSSLCDKTPIEPAGLATAARAYQDAKTHLEFASFAWVLRLLGVNTATGYDDEAARPA